MMVVPEFHQDTNRTSLGHKLKVMDKRLVGAFIIMMEMDFRALSDSGV